LKYRIGNTVRDKLHKLCFYRLGRCAVKHTALVTHFEVFHVLLQYLTHPLLYQLIQAPFYTGGRGMVFFMEFYQQAGFVLILQFPQVT